MNAVVRRNEDGYYGRGAEMEGAFGAFAPDLIRANFSTSGGMVGRVEIEEGANTTLTLWLSARGLRELAASALALAMEIESQAPVDAVAPDDTPVDEVPF